MFIHLKEFLLFCVFVIEYEARPQNSMESMYGHMDCPGESSVAFGDSGGGGHAMHFGQEDGNTAIENFANGLGDGGGNEENYSSGFLDCEVSTGKQVKEVSERPQVRLISTDKEEGKEEVDKTDMDPTECQEIEELNPQTSVKVETYTIPYVVTEIKYKTVTRKRHFVQRKRKIKQKFHKPQLVVKRKAVKEKQTYERVLPRVIETREIINKPEVKETLEEGPFEEVSDPGELEHHGYEPPDGAIDVDEDDCDEGELFPNQGSQEFPLAPVGRGGK